MQRLINLIGVGVIALAVSGPDEALGEELNDSIEILTDDGTKVGQLPCEKNYIPFEGMRGDARMGVTRAGDVYVALGEKLCCSRDGGRTWKSRDLPLPSGGFGILRDDTFVVFTGFPDCGVIRSTDCGSTWSEKAPLDLAPFTSGGGGWSQIIHPPGTPALMTVTLRNGDGVKDHEGNPLPADKVGIHDHLFRSTDFGKTWNNKTMIVPDSAESSVLVLRSGKMLAAIRKQRHPQRFLPGDDIDVLKAMDGWRDGRPYVKHGFLAESIDDGNTWVNEHLAPNTPDMRHGLCPSDLVQLPDERVVWIYTHRYGRDGGVMARTSSDEGKTWSAVRYRIRRLPQLGHGTYPTNAVFADGTILTVCGKNQGNRAIAVRWRIPAN